MADGAGEKKIFIDEDWKSRVEAEREDLEGKRGQEAPSQPQPDAMQPDAMQPDAIPSGSMPPASLEMLLTTLATEAMVGMGHLPHPATGKASVNLEQAKYFVDTLEMLQEKTKGNLTEEESLVTENLLHQLRLAFVEAQSRPPADPAAGPG